MAAPIDELLHAISRLPLPQRAELIERVGREIAEPPPPVSSRALSLLGLMQGEPELVDRVCALAYAARNNGTNAEPR